MYWHMKVKKCFFTVHSYFKITLFRCSLPTAMSISRSEILRGKKGPKLKNSWEIMGGQWEVMWGLWGSWEVSEWSWEVSGRLKGGHGRSPGGYKMLIANAIAEQRLYPSFFGSDIWVKSESNEDQKSAYSQQSGFRDKNAYLFHWSMEKKISYST